MRNKRHLKIAVCNDILEFQGNQLLSQEWAKRFPGADWFRFLSSKANDLGWEVASGDIALLHIQSGYWNAKSTYVVQELGSSYGNRLMDLGARPLLLTAFESPLYAGPFYDKIHHYIGLFPEVMAPMDGNHELGLTIGSNIWPLSFPCYSEADRALVNTPWSERRKLCLVASNKYWATRTQYPSIFEPRRFLGWLRQDLIARSSKSRKKAIQHQLHDVRLKMVEYFSKEKSLDLYGKGWGELSHLPKKWRKALALAAINNNGHIDSKLRILNQYQFAICCENVALPGYVTEKIVDCIVARTIPIYMGAPDVDQYVPKDCYVDARDFLGPEDLDHYLNKITKDQALNIMIAGEKFLNSAKGKRHSYENFSQWIIDLAKKHESNI